MIHYRLLDKDDDDLVATVESLSRNERFVILSLQIKEAEDIVNSIKHLVQFEPNMQYSDDPERTLKGRRL